jgi:hypothetical protein
MIQCFVSTSIYFLLLSWLSLKEKKIGLKDLICYMNLNLYVVNVAVPPLFCMQLWVFQLFTDDRWLCWDMGTSYTNFSYLS